MYPGITPEQLMRDITRNAEQLGKPIRVVNVDSGEYDVYDIVCVSTGPNGELELMIRYCDTEEDNKDSERIKAFEEAFRVRGIIP